MRRNRKIEEMKNHLEKILQTQKGKEHCKQTDGRTDTDRQDSKETSQEEYKNILTNI